MNFVLGKVLKYANIPSSLLWTNEDQKRFDWCPDIWVNMIHVTDVECLKINSGGDMYRMNIKGYLDFVYFQDINGHLGVFLNK